MQTRMPNVWRQLSRLVPEVRAEQEELDASDCDVESEDPDKSDHDSDSDWYEHWVDREAEWNSEDGDERGSDEQSSG
jgi:hypothetical protein